MDIYKDLIEDIDSDILANICLDQYENGNVLMTKNITKDHFITELDSEISSRIIIRLEEYQNIFILDVYEYDNKSKKLQWKFVKVQNWNGYHWKHDVNLENSKITGTIFFEDSDNRTIRLEFFSKIHIHTVFYIQKNILNFIPLSLKNITLL
jgi:hypothetical protein